MVNLDFLGLLEGVPFDDGKTEGFDLQLGSNTFVKGFEEQIMGRRAGESFEIAVTFPDPYPAQELAGKEAVFQIALNEVRRLVVPQPSEEIAARSGYPSLAAMTDAVREQRLALHRKKREEEVKAELLKQLVQETEREIPEELLFDAADRLRSHLLTQLRAGGQNLALYLKRNALTEEELEQQLRERASDAVTKQMVVDAIARREQLLPTEGEIEAEHQRFLERTKRPDSPRLKTLVKERLCCERVAQHLLEHSGEG
jgi:trigger factor